LYKGKIVGGFPKKFQLDLRKKEKPDVVVNLGITEPVGFTGRILNSREMIQAGSNKRRARRQFAEAGVPSPLLFLTGQQITKENLPVVGRTSYHRKGEGFWFCRTLRDVQRAAAEGATHFMEFVPNTREYRVHTFVKSKHWNSPAADRQPESYASIKISEKVWTGDGEPDPDSPQKNHEFGWSFLAPQNRREEEIDVVRYAAKQAIAALGMDFGAVDVMYRLSNKLPYVLEVNSTPSMADEVANTCEIYAKRILRTIGVLKEEETSA
jgi:hypothetical protein